MSQKLDPEKQKILEIKTGSHLYGTNTPESDVDFCGVFIPPINYYFGLDKVGEVDLSIIDKLDNGKNTKDAVDRKFYELRKFVTLAMENNPNLLEILSVNKPNIVYANDIGIKLLDNKHLFPHKGLERRFIGYSLSQKKKLYVKSGNMNDLKEGLTKLEFFHYNVINGRPNLKYIFQIENDLINSGFFKDNENQHFKIGDIFIQKNITIKNAIGQVKNRISKFGNRKDLVEEFGFDLKFGSHCVRLLLEGKELLETGEIKFPLSYADLILEIKSGKYSLSELEEMIEYYENEIRLSFEKTQLPSKPQYDKINKMLIDILQQHFYN